MDEVALPPSPIGRALGDAFATLPVPVQMFHGTAGGSRWSGVADISGGTSRLARRIRRRLGMPEPARRVPVTVTVALRPDGSGTWIRDYGERRFVSVFATVPGEPQTIVERRGAIALVFALTGNVDGVVMTLRRWSVGSVALPLVLAPRIDARESVDAAGRYRFDVSVGLPLIGHVVGYRGTLEPVDGAGFEGDSGARAPA